MIKYFLVSVLSVFTKMFLNGEILFNYQTFCNLLRILLSISYRNAMLTYRFILTLETF